MQWDWNRAPNTSPRLDTGRRSFDGNVVPDEAQHLADLLVGVAVGTLLHDDGDDGRGQQPAVLPLADHAVEVGLARVDLPCGLLLEVGPGALASFIGSPVASTSLAECQPCFFIAPKTSLATMMAGCLSCSPTYLLVIETTAFLYRSSSILTCSRVRSTAGSASALTCVPESARASRPRNTPGTTAASSAARPPEQANPAHRR